MQTETQTSSQASIPEQVFRAYDIRGIIQKEITPEFMRKLGQVFVTLYNIKEVVVGYDARPSSQEFTPYFVEGVTSQGANVRMLGMEPSELVTGTAGELGIKHAAIITASHNPQEYVGIKLYKNTAEQIAIYNGMLDIKTLMLQSTLPESEIKGTITPHNPWPDYVTRISELVGDTSDWPTRRVLVDAGNGTGGAISNHFATLFHLDVVPMFFEPDGTYPNHTPNPMVPTFRKHAEDEARKNPYELTIIFDGDADRIGFLDHEGTFIPSDFIGTLIADHIIQKKYPGSTTVIDLRRGWTTVDSAKQHNYPVLTTIAGNPFIKKGMRETDAAYGFEASAHNVYKDYYYSESSSLTLGYVLSIMAQTGKNLRELVEPYAQNHAMIEEMNYETHDAQKIFSAIENHFPDAKTSKEDGLSVDYSDWHLNIRASNTEPLIRLNLEARTQSILDQKFIEVATLIHESGGTKQDH